jgi:pimeloyl-ACP methyl ester carboxylesterase
MSPGAEAGISGYWRSAAERADELLAVEVPTLVVLGALDVITPPAGGRRMAEQLRSGDVVVLDGVGHFPWVDGADAFVEALETFLGDAS